MKPVHVALAGLKYGYHAIMKLNDKLVPTYLDIYHDQRSELPPVSAVRNVSVIMMIAGSMIPIRP